MPPFGQIAKVVAYLRSQPAVQRDSNFDAPSNGVNLLGAVLLGTGIAPTSVMAPIAQPVVAPARGATAE